MESSLNDGTKSDETGALVLSDPEPVVHENGVHEMDIGNSLNSSDVTVALEEEDRSAALAGVEAESDKTGSLVADPAHNESGIEIVEEVIFEKESGPVNGTSDKSTVNKLDAASTDQPQPKHESAPTIVSKKNQPPGLVRLDHNYPSQESPDERPSLNATDTSKEAVSLEKSSGPDPTPEEHVERDRDKDVTVLKISRVPNPVVERCRGCLKSTNCTYYTVCQKTKTSLKFCSRKCVEVCFADDKRSTSDEETSGHTEPTIADSMVVEPDIEIQTLSDDILIEEAEADYLNDGIKSITSQNVDSIIDAVAQQAVCCCSCKTSLLHRVDTISWEAMEFCSDKCLRFYVKVIGSHCNQCSAQVSDVQLGKLCVRFGTVIRQFCSPECLEKFKQNHKLCSQCQTNMTDKDQKYCSPACDELARRLANQSDHLGTRVCSVCNEKKPIVCEVFMGGQSHWLCSKPCRNAFRFANKLTTLECTTCARYFDSTTKPHLVLKTANKWADESKKALQIDWFCAEVCFASHLLKRRTIEQCPRCKVKKYNVDMIRKPPKNSDGPALHYCSLHCFNVDSAVPGALVSRTKSSTPAASAPPSVQVSASTDSAQLASSTGNPPLAPPPATASVVKTSVSIVTRNQASLAATAVVAPTAKPSSVGANQAPVTPAAGTASVQASSSTSTQMNAAAVTSSPGPINTATSVPVEVHHKIVFVPPKPKEMKNKSVSCRPASVTCGESQTQTDLTGSCDSTEEVRKPLYIPVIIPVPVPIYVPIPMAMYSFPAPVPIGFPVPLPTPVVLPVASSSITEAMDAIKESTANAENADAVNVDIDEMDTVLLSDLPDASDEAAQQSPETTSNLEESPALPPDQHTDDLVDFESNIRCSSILPPHVLSRKRSLSTSQSANPSPKRLKELSNQSASDGEEPDREPFLPSLTCNGSFKKEIGTRAWSQWLANRASGQEPKVVDRKLSAMNTHELNVALVAFVNEVRRPSGQQYRPDVLLYFIYGLQGSFVMDQRRENLFMDAALQPFQEELDKHLRPFYDSVVKAINSEDAGPRSPLITGLKESHLWECRQLGVDSPIVLVFTMLYFNTKFFRLYTAEQHARLSFTSIQKKLVLNGEPSANGTPSRPSAKAYSLQLIETALLQGDSRFKTKPPLEQPPVTNAPALCPIKHYNFYLLKCPESVKTRRDMFYLLPKSDCLPDSSVWYSTTPVPKDVLSRMLRRVLLVEGVLRNLFSSD